MACKFKLERVDEFVYLRVLIEKNWMEEQKMKARLAKRNNKYGIISLRAFMKSRHLLRRAKFRVYTYACGLLVVLNKVQEAGTVRTRKKDGEEELKNRYICCIKKSPSLRPM